MATVMHLSVPAYADTPVPCGSDLGAAITGAASGETLTLDDYCVYVLTTALPSIDKTLVIDGNHATVQRSTATGTGSFRIFDVISGGDLTLMDLTAMNGSAGLGAGISVTGGGKLTGDNLTVQGNHGFVGGGLFIEGGATAMLNGGMVNDNSADQGGGMQNDGNLTLSGTRVSGNHPNAGGNGGGVLSLGGSLTMTAGTTITGNTATRGPGGVTTTGTATIDGTSITNNIGGFSGGMNAAAGTVTISNSTIAGNTARRFRSSDNFYGGAGLETSATTTLTNTKVINNRSVTEQGRGAGISAFDGTLTVQGQSVISGNVASGRYSLGGGIFATAEDGPTSVIVSNSTISNNKVTGTGAAAGGIYNLGADVSLDSVSVTGNSAPSAPAPGGIYTTTAIAPTGTTTITGNTPTNCIFSPAPVTGCIG
ncbi:hypothetical protein [Streptomyces sp. NPDC086787]|uniref:hypothetical protein n=1 Tax=Streptomyces sp. NPDC086787 TaxID=3365759 RepID=UPI003806B08E